MGIGPQVEVSDFFTANVDFLNSSSFSSDDLPTDTTWPLLNGVVHLAFL